MKFLKLMISALLLGLAIPSHATLTGIQAEADGEPEAEPVEQAISQSPGAGDDARIAERIKGIFGELPGFETVQVDVKEGVVTLSGALSDAGTITRAEAIAGRVSGVVTVQNEIERDLSVKQNLSVLGQASDLTRDIISVLPLLTVALIVALAIGALGFLIAGFGALWNRIAPNAFLAGLIASAIRFVFVIGGVVIGLDMLGAGALLGAVLGGAGVVGIALGFAMRDTIENYVASLMLSLRQPFRPNDHVLINEHEGRVIRLTSRATVLMTLDGNHLRIPNSQVFTAVIVNYTRNPQRRLGFELGIDADDDPRAAMKHGSDTLLALPFILSEPAPVGRIEQVGDSNIVILFLGWVDQRQADWGKSRSLAIAAVKDALEGAGFALPEPIYRLRFDGRTGPLPIGRSADLAQTAPAQPAKSTSPRASVLHEHDTRPENEIADMVDYERDNDPERSDDLLDSGRPVE